MLPRLDHLSVFPASKGMAKATIHLSSIPRLYSLGQSLYYCRLSKDDDQAGESVSIGTQKSMLEGYCREQGFLVHDFYVDDGYSGLNFNRPGFERMLKILTTAR